MRFLYSDNKCYVQYVPANTQPWVNACAASQYHWSVKIHSFWHHLPCFWKRMPQTRPDFVFMLGFYHNFSITSPKKISYKIIAMLSKTQRIFIIEHYLHLHYWTKMSDTFTFNRTELVPIRQYKPWNFYANFSMTDLFPLGYGPTKPGPNPIGFLPVGVFKKYDFCHSSSHHQRVETTYYHGNAEHYSENVAKGFSKYDALRCYV